MNFIGRFTGEICCFDGGGGQILIGEFSLIFLSWLTHPRGLLSQNLEHLKGIPHEVGWVALVICTGAFARAISLNCLTVTGYHT